MTTDTPKFMLVLAEPGKLRTYTTVKAISRALEDLYFRGVASYKIELFLPRGLIPELESREGHPHGQSQRMPGPKHRAIPSRRFTATPG